jgi:hypothetical protein
LHGNNLTITDTGGSGSGGKFASYRGNITAGGGGAASGANTSTGNGGDIVKTIFTVGLRADSIVAGDSPAPTGTGIAGKGGSILGLTVLGTGDIGDAGATFSSNGGVRVGKSSGAAKNGSINGLTANVITSILAGTPASNAITAANAVTSIAGIKATSIGVDINGNFIVTDNVSTWTGPGDTDTLQDGIVIVKNTTANIAALAKIIAPNFLFAV